MFKIESLTRENLSGASPAHTESIDRLRLSTTYQKARPVVMPKSEGIVSAWTPLTGGWTSYDHQQKGHPILLDQLYQ